MIIGIESQTGAESSQPPLSRRCDSLSEGWTGNGHADAIKGAHQRLDPDLENLIHELPDGFLSLWAGRVVRDGRGRNCRRPVGG